MADDASCAMPSNVPIALLRCMEQRSPLRVLLPPPLSPWATFVLVAFARSRLAAAIRRSQCAPLPSVSSSARISPLPAARIRVITAGAAGGALLLSVILIVLPRSSENSSSLDPDVRPLHSGWPQTQQCLVMQLWPVVAHTRFLSIDSLPLPPCHQREDALLIARITVLAIACLFSLLGLGAFVALHLGNPVRALADPDRW